MEHSTNAAPLSAYIQRWGTHASFMLVERPCTLFQVPTIDGVIGYYESNSSLVVLGDPLVGPQDLLMLISEFNQFAFKQKKTVVYLNASQTFVDCFSRYFNPSIIGIGHEFVIDASRDLLKESGHYACALRQKYNKSVRAGIEVQEYYGDDAAVEEQIQLLGDSWLHRRSGPQAFFYDLNIFANRAGKRWFYAQQRGSIIGILTMNRIAHNGWVVNMVLTSPNTINSLSAFMIIKTLEQLRREGGSFLSAGILADNQLGDIKGIGRLKKWAARKVYNLCNRLIKLDKRRQYWQQFQPEQRPCYIVANSTFGIKEGLAIMQALHMMPALGNKKKHY